jgi:hypothetical protein
VRNALYNTVMVTGLATADETLDAEQAALHGAIGIAARETLPHRGAKWINRATSGHNQRSDFLDFLESPKGSNPFCSSIFF